MAKEELIPDASHPITVTPTPGRVRVTAGETVIADSTASLTLQEASYPAVQYVPIADVDRSLLTSTATQTYCPFKGDASYYSVRTSEGVIEDAGWTYLDAYDAVGEITDHVAFYPDKVDISVEG